MCLQTTSPRVPVPWRLIRLTTATIGIALCLGAPAAYGQTSRLSDSRLGTRTAPILLLTRPDVQADLALSPEQIDAAAKMIEALRARAGNLRGQGDTPDIVAARRAVDQAQGDWIETNLSVEQQARLLQIDLQWEGPAALLTRPMVAEALDLDPAQRRSLADAVTRYRRLSVSSRAGAEQIRELARSALSILTDEQQGRWHALLGQPFVVQRDLGRDPAVQQAAGAR